MIIKWKPFEMQPIDMSNMRCFNAQKIALDHCVKERKQLIVFSMILRMSRVEGDIVDPTLKELQRC